MNETRKLILAHMAHYPGMELDDCLKLLYQSELGGGHLIENEAAFADALRDEMAQPGLFDEGLRAPLAVGGGSCRVCLSALKDGPAPETLAKLCARSARLNTGSMEGLAKKLETLRALDAEGLLPWPGVAARIDEYLAVGCPLCHHSRRYKALYKPHYRLMDETAALFLPAFAALDRALLQKPHVLAGIDGMCASGKSSLANLIAEIYGCGVVRADDFFLQPHQRNPARLAEPGGNIDYERLAVVARQAAGARAFGYQAYDCQSGALLEKRLQAGRLTLLEGAYCLSVQVGAPCDVRLFVCVDAMRQSARIWARSPRLAQRFKNEWIPMENIYFAAFCIREGCDVVLDTTALG